MVFLRKSRLIKGQKTIIIFKIGFIREAKNKSNKLNCNTKNNLKNDIDKL